MRRNTAKVLRQARTELRASRPALRPAPAVQPKAPAAPLTLGDLIAATYDVVGDDTARVAEVLTSPELRRRIDRQIFFI